MSIAPITGPMMVPMPPISDDQREFHADVRQREQARRVDHAHIHGEQPAADAGEERRERHALQLRLQHIDAGRARRVFVGAHRQQIMAEPRAPQPHG